MRTNLNNWLVMSVFLLGLASNAAGQIATGPTEDVETVLAGADKVMCAGTAVIDETERWGKPHPTFFRYFPFI